LATLIADDDSCSIGDAVYRCVLRVNHHLGTPLFAERARCLVESRVEEIACRRCREAKRMGGIRLLDNVPMVWQLGHLVDRPGMIGTAERHIRPIRPEAELAVRPGKPLDVMGGFEIRLT